MLLEYGKSGYVDVQMTLADFEKSQSIVKEQGSIKKGVK